MSAADEKIVRDFYNNTVFVGDSIVAGFASFVSINDYVPEYIKDIKFLSAASYGIDAALNNKTLIYEGQAGTLIDNLKKINPDKVFINLGVNELDGVDAEKVGKKYKELISNIQSEIPDTDIYILGVTYFVEGKETKTYTNDGIRAFNKYISDNADDWGVTFLDFGKYMSNSKGYLPDNYSSDGRIHHNNRAFRRWISYLQEIALDYSK